MTTVQRTFQLEESLDRQFCEMAEKLGTTPSDALRIFVEAFVAQKGFPFAWTLHEEKVLKRTFNANHPAIITPPIRNGHAVLPASWREDEDDDP